AEESLAGGFDSGSELGFFGERNSAEVEQEAIVFDTGDDCRANRGFAEAGFERGGGEARRRNGNKVGFEVVVGRGTGADDGETGYGFDFRIGRLRRAERVAETCGELSGARGEFAGREANHAQSGNFIEGAAEVGVESGFERGDGEFVHAQGTEERIAAD